MSKIPAKTTLRCLRSVGFMNYQYGHAFNGMITLNFSQLGIEGERDASRALTKLNEALADKIKLHGLRWQNDWPHYFLYAHEDVPTSHGHHVHELVVVPRGLGADMNRWLQRWAKRTFGQTIDPRAVHYKGEYHSDLARRIKLQARLVGYILKSTEDRCIPGRGDEPTTLHTILEVEKRPRAYCARVGRVVGTSENIASLEQLRCAFWVPAYMEQVMSGVYLKDHYADIAAEELWNCLRRIDD